MACNCNKADRREVWKRHIAGFDANRIAAQLMSQLSLVKDCIAAGDPDAVKASKKTKIEE
tara:strand:- start:420 stop:599 length:180 start_codon:yes stop_codon:yes gene_type:complete